jgi:hypothetical protein
VFDSRYVPTGHFQRGESVWVVHEGRICRGAIEQPDPDPELGTILVSVPDRALRLWATPGAIFKRPTEYHLLRAAVDDLIDELKRDCRELLLETGR